MKLIICCNHTFPHCGGSERVVKQISDAMAAAPYNHEVIVVSRSTSSSFEANGVKYIPCAQDAKSFLKQLSDLKPDHTHIYSDYFAFWGDLLRNSEKVPGKKSIALVGMNKMIGNPSSLIDMRVKADQIQAITHSDNYQDYRICTEEGIPVRVIPNGVDMSEFNYCKTEDIDIFRALTAAANKKQILCVSNFFPGKGQEHLIKVLSKLKTMRQDWEATFISTTVNFPFATILSNKAKADLKRESIPHQFLVDIPREKVLNHFKTAHVFAFPSQKEVAPLVAIESQAACLPWVALPVGNVPQLRGGLMAVPGVKDSLGFLRYTEETYKTFAEHLDKILESSDLRIELGQKGRSQVEASYDWRAIAAQYNEVFTK